MEAELLVLREGDVAVEGWAAVTGTWSNDRLRAERQILQGHPSPRLPVWTTPPCLPPAGGWPLVTRNGDIDLDFNLGDLRDSGAAVSITLFRPGPDRAV